MPEIRFDRVTRTFGAVRAVDDLSATIGEREFFVVLGPSGCGKSTLLRLLAGLETVTGGEIRMGDELWSAPSVHLRPEARGVGFVFQSYALWPHMTVMENVAFPAQTARLPEREWRPLANRCLEAVGLAALAGRRPGELSGGQRQRVALARVLASQARLALMDEPLANLDPHLRATMEAEFARFHRLSGATTIYITHDQREAMGMADRIAVMMDGRFLQVDAPDTLYWRPASLETAGFIGRGAALPARIVSRGGGRAVAELPQAGTTLQARDNPEVDGDARLFVRPEEVALGEDGLPAEVVRATYRGGLWEVTLTLGHAELEAVSTLRVRPGETVRATLRDGWPLPAPPVSPATGSCPPAGAATAP